MWLSRLQARAGAKFEMGFIMTYCKLLATAQRDDDVIEAWEMWETLSKVPWYQITISAVDSSEARIVIETAKTTWKRKFKYLANIT